MASMMCLIPLPKSTTLPVGCSLLRKSNLIDRVLRHRTTFAADNFRPRDTTNRMKRLSESYMFKMKQKYETRLQKRLNPKGVRLSEGIPPSLLTEIDEGLKAVLKRRQRVLNKIFMENLTEVLSTNPIGDYIKENGVLITQCEVTKDCQILQVYYHCDKSKAKEVVTELNRIKEMLRSLLTQKYIMGKVPTIEYIYDLSYEKNSDLTEQFSSLEFGHKEEEVKKINQEEGEENRQHDSPITSQKVGGSGCEDDFLPPKPDPEPFRPLGTSRKAKSLTNFDPEHAFQYTHNPYDNQKALSRFLTFNHPDDMRMDTFSLDYKNIVNKILFNLVKNRHPSQSFNPMSDPLPPVDWSSVKPMPRLPPDMSDPAQNFKGRVATMRKFLIENRKKKQILAREAKRIKEQMSLEASNNLNRALDNIGFTSDYPEESTISSLDDYEYLHSKLERMEEIVDKGEDN